MQLPYPESTSHSPTYWSWDCKHICTICCITTYQHVNYDHLTPTCYLNQQQLPRYLTGHSPSLLPKPGTNYQQLFNLQHRSICSLAISKRTSSQLPLTNHQPAPEPLTHHYWQFSSDEIWRRQQIYDWLIDRPLTYSRIVTLQSSSNCGLFQVAPNPVIPVLGRCCPHVPPQASTCEVPLNC